MYQITEIDEVIAIPPEALGMGIEETVERLVREKYECHMHRDKGFVLFMDDISMVGEGIVAHGNSSIYQKVKFKALVFKPYLHEVIDGIVCKIVEFGAFCHTGPVDSLVHVSQVMDDYVDVDQLNGRLV
jgi:DNA-directed RNA polymerase subunit E'